MTAAASPEPQTLTVLKALANNIRYEIVRILARGERCVCDLEAALNLPQSKVSYHLAALRDAGLIVGEQRGKNSFYRLLPEPLYLLGGELLRDIYLAELPLTYQSGPVC
ncbi:winged helix-turn-helix transcriptional regulator [Deinococcus sp. SDU3-2]|uniref:Winged helix-turn-helix transcriptional regulator n=2 Tax=Deinococcus TaxID=1298 RepID=A0A7X1NYP5_9DEIO|nr:MULTISPECIES: metalloregulator ArsR/SmtB family transcription factor [Deinococcus]MDL2345388.1 metalloregulator ArsR/SmtB family transcription factor [Deinococcus rhizophilus]MPY68163.1 winged helix-turn-helix transcriptional regulator [Deinococcus terrestris]